MNVALTRARVKLVVVGDGATVSRHAFYALFFAHAEASGAWRSAWERRTRRRKCALSRNSAGGRVQADRRHARFVGEA